MNDTIVAISTALGVGAISIVRISGQEAIKIANSIFEGSDLEKVKSHTIHFGYIYDGEEKIDEVLISVMRTPKTFTMEDVVEINCHGGINTTNKVLSLVISKGARLAEPGEFSKRAYINGRIDLIEAEGIMSLIEAKTDKMRQLALNQVDGKVSLLIKELRKKIRDILINIEVNIDYPEYEDILVITKEMIEKNIAIIKDKALEILKDAERGKIISEGIRTVIIGRPNVGKSSILNHLLNEDKAIVTDQPGTTRDIVEGRIDLGGVLLNIVDTAGIRKSTDLIEQIGVAKSLKSLDDADLIILVLNNNEKISDEDLEIIKTSSSKERIIFINKNDLPSKINMEALEGEKIVFGNTMSPNSLNSLKTAIIDLFSIDKIGQKDLTYLSNARQVGLLSQALTSINDVELGLSNGVPVDMLAIDLQNVWELLGEIIGENYHEELIEELFKQFCLGK